MPKYLDDIFESERKEKERRKKAKWYRKIDWGDIFGWIGAALFTLALFAAAGCFVWCIVWVVTAPTQDAKNQAHYDKDFRTFCSQLHGKPQIKKDPDSSYSGLCLSPENKILMYSGKASRGVPNYDKDFTRFCTDRGGKTLISGDDLCVKNEIVIMRES